MTARRDLEAEVDVWNPPLVNPATGARRSSLAEAADLFADLISHDVRTICFLKSRRGIELIRKFAAERLDSERQAGAGRTDRPVPGRLHPGPAARRSRPDLVSGELLGVVSTSALELGIDIGETRRGDLRHLSGHRRHAAADVGPGRTSQSPGSRSTSPGRTGSTSTSAGIPAEFLERPVEAAILDHRSPEIAAQHMLAAAFELPLTAEDERWFGDDWSRRPQRC